MKEKMQRRHTIDILFVLILFTAFALCALILVIMGANIYDHTVDNMDTNFTQRTSYAYVTEKFRQNDVNASVSIGSFDDYDALVFSSEIDGTIYETYLYAYENSLMELFTKQGTVLPAKAGNSILQIDSFSVEEIYHGTFSCTIKTPDGKSTCFYLTARTNQ